MKQVLLIFLAFYLIYMAFLYFQQKKFIFHPTQARHQLNDQRSRDFSHNYNGVSLNGWLVNYGSVSRKLLIYYGGNAEDIFYSIEMFKKYGDTSTLLVNYRGYGLSTGSPSEENLFADALAVYDEVLKRFSPRQIFLMGRSLGSGIAIYVAAHRKTDGLILVTPYDSIENLAKKHFPYMPVSLLLHHKFLSFEYAQKTSQPSLILYGGKDRTVPPANTEKLIEYLPGKKKIVFIEDAEHNNIELFAEYDLEVLKFIE